MSQGLATPFLATTTPTTTVYTTGSGTYTTPNNVQFLIVELVGGGGGGGGGGTTGAGIGVTGGTTTFGSLSATGGVGGVPSGNAGGWGASSPGIGSGGDVNAAGGTASPYFPGNASLGTATNGYAPAGGNSIYGGGGLGGANGGDTGKNATGFGGGGGGAGGTNAGGGITGTVGGSGGGYCRKVISNPSATYSYSVGAGGASGTVGTNGAAGGAGSGGLIVISEYYNVLGVSSNLNLPLVVDQGGTGATSATAYAVQCGGTTSTGAHQSIASVGTSGQVLTSNGAGALPTFQSIITDWVAYTPTFTGFGTPTNVQIWSRRVGDTLHIRGRFAGGTSTATEARITLGYNGTNANVTSSSTKITSIQLAGFACYNAAGNVSNTLIESNVGYITFGLQNPSTVGGGLAKQNGNVILGSGTVYGFQAEVPVDTWP